MKFNIPLLWLLQELSICKNNAFSKNTHTILQIIQVAKNHDKNALPLPYCCGNAEEYDYTSHARIRSIKWRTLSSALSYDVCRLAGHHLVDDGPCPS